MSSSKTMFALAAVVGILVSIAVALLRNGIPAATYVPSSLSGKTAVITGGTAGIGEALVHRLMNAGAKVIVIARNKRKAEAVFADLKNSAQKDNLKVIVADMSVPKSVINAAKELNGEKIDLMFLNAGIFPHYDYYWMTLLKAFFTFRMEELFERGNVEGNPMLKQHVGLRTKDGLGDVFASNVFGHWLLVDALKDSLKKAGSRLIWTGSRAANKKFFGLDDLQHLEGPDPYGSSKYLTDVVTMAWNHGTFRGSRVETISCCPGFVYSSMMPIVVRAFKPIFWVLSFCVHNFSYTPYNGAEVLVQVADANELPSIDEKYFMKHKVALSHEPLDASISTELSESVLREFNRLKGTYIGSHEGNK